ncbi:MAG: potassium transporter TrkG [Hydrogeniiclostridium sp.]
MGAFFHSVSARTAGFSTYPIGEFSNAGLFTLIPLMFIGASPGSTGGGIKTSTFFVLMQEIRSLFTKTHIGALYRDYPHLMRWKQAGSHLYHVCGPGRHVHPAFYLDRPPCPECILYGKIYNHWIINGSIL